MNQNRHFFRRAATLRAFAFEDFVSELFSRLGYTVEREVQASGVSIDMLVKRDGLSSPVEVSIQRGRAAVPKLMADAARLRSVVAEEGSLSSPIVVMGSPLFEVQGRSAEPLALNSQLLITHSVTFGPEALKRLEGRLVVAVDDTGERYFKRLRVHGKLVVLESVNPDGTTPAQLLSLDGSHGYPTLTNLLEVAGVIFEVPAA